jgi:hypothetical protein
MPPHWCVEATINAPPRSHLEHNDGRFSIAGKIASSVLTLPAPFQPHLVFSPGSGIRRRAVQDGLFILQVVGRTVSAASTRVMFVQPQPVLSSSNFSVALSGPKLAMYMGWKNWWSP